MIVVDTNIIAYLWIPGENTALAERLLDRDPDWAAPYLWRSEFRNVLGGCARRSLLSYEHAARLIAQAERHMRGREHAVSSDDVLERVRQSRCSAYDCEFVVLAERLGTSLVTTDKQVLAEFPGTAIAPSEFLSR